MTGIFRYPPYIRGAGRSRYSESGTARTVVVRRDFLGCWLGVAGLESGQAACSVAAAVARWCCSQCRRRSP
jgi:hypothetical protein